MAISVDDSVTRFTALGTYDGNPVTATSGSFTPANNSLLVVCIGASEASTNAASISSVSGGGLTWTSRGTRGTGNNGGGTNSPGFCAIYTAPVSTGSSMTVSTAITWADNFVAFRVSSKVYIVTSQDASPIGTTGSGGPTQTPAAGAEYTPTLFTATGAGRAFYCMSEQNGSSGSDGISTSTDTEDAAYYASELVGIMSAYKASDHTSGSQTGSIDPTAQTYVNWVALEVLAGAEASALLMGQACL